MNMPAFLSRTSPILLIGAVTLLGGFIKPQLWRGAESPSLLVVGDLAPHLALPIYPDSDKGFDLTEATEDQSLVVVTFWASWCLPCRVELHRLTELFDQYGEAGLEIVAVNLDSERQEIQRFLDESPLPFPVVLGNDSRCRLRRLSAAPALRIERRHRNRSRALQEKAMAIHRE
ncbi:MAG: TlpA disulfide reductase family protein, partial [Acidobacteriota bacterium]